MKETNTLYDKALTFAEKHHSGQMRDDGATPYIEHPKKVAKILREVAGVTDESILSAGLLHDMIEDSEVSYDDLEKAFGVRIAGLVAELTNDKRLPKQLSREDLIRRLPGMSQEAALIKLADIYSNAQDMGSADWTEERKAKYLVYLRRIVETISKSKPTLSPKLEKSISEYLQTL